MKRHRFKLIAGAFVALTALLAPAQAAIVVGTGNDISYLVIEAPAFGSPVEFEYHYTFNSAAPIDTYTMMTAIDDASSNLSFSFINYGIAGAPNYFLTSITYNSTELDNGDLFWAQWVSGGKSGYPTGVDIASGTWSEGSGVSAPYRTLAPGSWDGFVYNGEFNPDPPYELTSGPPSVAPVPEPATVVLLALGGLALLWRLRARHA